MTERKILVVDVGNSRAKFGLFERTGDTVQLLSGTAVSLRRSRNVAVRLADWAANHTIDECVVAGSNPPIVDRLNDEWPESLPRPTIIRSGQRLPVRLMVDQPDAVGIDRVLNALAAGRLYPKRSVIIADSGTATTVDLISKTGDFLGGTIFPGLRLSAYALHDYTARLPMIDVDAEHPHDPRLPGRNTEEAIRSGLYWGQLGAIREIIDRLSAACDDAPVVILTGGALNQLHPHLPDAVGIESLALHGLALLSS